jgi:hypothetical protein
LNPSFTTINVIPNSVLHSNPPDIAAEVVAVLLPVVVTEEVALAVALADCVEETVLVADVVAELLTEEVALEVAVVDWVDVTVIVAEFGSTNSTKMHICPKYPLLHAQPPPARLRRWRLLGEATSFMVRT